MKQKKTKILSFLLAVTMLLSVPATSLASDISENTGQENQSQEDNINYLDKLKETAQKDVETKAAEKIEEINSEEAEETEKTVAIKTVNDVKNKALVEIKAAKTEEEVETAKSTGITAIEEISVKKAEDNLKGARAVADDGINTFQELKDAIADSTVNEIVVSGNIEIAETLNIDHPITIKGINEDITLTGNAPSGNYMFQIGDSANAVMIQSLIFNGDNKNGAIESNEIDLTIDNAKFTNNTAEYYGAIYIKGKGNTIISNSVFNGNKSEEWYGGAIYFEEGNGTAVIENSVFTGNTANYGGAVYLSPKDDYSMSLKVINSNFEGNKSVGQGGAIAFNTVGQLDLEDTKFKDNVSSLAGAAIYVMPTNEMGVKVHLKNCNIEKNIIEPIGSENITFGAVYIGAPNTIDQSKSEVSIDGTTFKNNENTLDTQGLGGALAIMDTNGMRVNIDNSNFEGNEARNGGAIITSEFYSGNFKIANTTLKDNKAVQGGAIYYNGVGTLDIKDSTIQDSVATGNFGGGLYLYPAYPQGVKATLDTVKFENNTAGSGGGAITILTYDEKTDSDVVIKGSTFKNNSTGEGGFGGAISTYMAKYIPINISSSVFEENKADFGGAINIEQGYEGSQVTVVDSTFKNNTA